MKNDNVNLNRELRKLWTELETKETEVVNDLEYEKLNLLCIVALLLWNFRQGPKIVFVRLMNLAQ
jgi:hypothetical protein